MPALAYFEILDTWKRCKKQQLLQDLKPFDSNDPHAVARTVLLPQQRRVAVARSINHAAIDKRFEAAVKGTTRARSDLETGSMASATASLGAKARHCWVPHPEHGASAAAYNADLDNANQRRYQRGRNIAMQAVATCTRNNGQNRFKSQSDTQGVLAKSEDRSSQHGTSKFSQARRVNGLLKEGITQRGLPNQQRARTQDVTIHFIGAKRDEGHLQNSPSAKLSAFMTPSAVDTVFRRLESDQVGTVK